MGIDIMGDIWNRSPYSGHTLLLHMAIGEASYPTMAGLEVHTLLSELSHKGRFCQDGETIEQLLIMKHDGHIEELDIIDPGKDWARVTCVLNLEPLIPSVLQRQHESVIEERDELRDRLSEVFKSVDICGYVYLLKAGPYYKIGKTGNLDRRLDQLAIQLPHKPVILHAIASHTPDDLERYMHERFDHQRMNGEWFELSQEHIDFFVSFSRFDVGLTPRTPL